MCEWTRNLCIKLVIIKKLDIYDWGAGLEVSGSIQDIGQKVLQSSFQIGSSSSPTYFQIFYVIASLEKAFIRNVTIILWINYTIIICITNNNNATINNNYGRLQDLILHFKIPTGTHKKKCLEIYRQFGHVPSKRFASTVLCETELPQHSYGQRNTT